MATIKTNRDAAKQFNGRTCKPIRAVVPADLSFNEDNGEKQVIVEIDGAEYQFYTAEVVLADGETFPKPKAVEPPKPAPPPPAPKPAPVEPKPVVAPEGEK
jgi:hypothetical protein